MLLFLSTVLKNRQRRSPYIAAYAEPPGCMNLCDFIKSGNAFHPAQAVSAVLFRNVEAQKTQLSIFEYFSSVVMVFFILFNIGLFLLAKSAANSCIIACSSENQNPLSIPPFKVDDIFLINCSYSSETTTMPVSITEPLIQIPFYGTVKGATSSFSIFMASKTKGPDLPLPCLPRIRTDNTVPPGAVTSRSLAFQRPGGPGAGAGAGAGSWFGHRGGNGCRGASCLTDFTCAPLSHSSTVTSYVFR